MSIEAMKLALEALVGDRAFLESDAPVEIWSANDKAITALRQAIEQAQQAEPVAWGMPNKDGDILDVISPDEHTRLEGSYTVPLYTSPPRRWPLPEYKIVKILESERMKWHKSPPTYEFDLAFARAIEAAHGIKENT